MGWKQDYSEISNVFQRFVSAWEDGTVDAIDECMVADPVTNFSMFGPLYSRELLKLRLKEHRKPARRAVFSVENYVCLIEEGSAQQTAYIHGCLDDGLYVFAGIFANQLKKGEKGWRLTEVSFDLMNDNCKTRQVGEDGIPAICAELSAPWYVVRNPVNMVSNEEQIKEIIYRYAFALDCSSVCLLEPVLAGTVKLAFEAVGEFNKAQGLKILKRLSVLGIRECHIMHLSKLQVTGNTAMAEVKCSTLEADTFYKLHFRKKEDAWQIISLRLYPNQVLE